MATIVLKNLDYVHGKKNIPTFYIKLLHDMRLTSFFSCLEIHTSCRVNEIRCLKILCNDILLPLAGLLQGTSGW